MVRTTYADIDPWTGAQLGDPYYEYTIIDEDGIAYSHLAHIASPTYVEKATDSSYVTDNNYQDFKEHLASYPGDFIWSQAQDRDDLSRTLIIVWEH